MILPFNYVFSETALSEIFDKIDSGYEIYANSVVPLSEIAAAEAFERHRRPDGSVTVDLQEFSGIISNCALRDASPLKRSALASLAPDAIVLRDEDPFVMVKQSFHFPSTSPPALEGFVIRKYVSFDIDVMHALMANRGDSHDELIYVPQSTAECSAVKLVAERPVLSVKINRNRYDNGGAVPYTAVFSSESMAV